MNLRLLRERAGMTQEQLADLCNVSRSTIAMIENGTNKPSVPLAQRICMILKCTWEELLGNAVNSNSGCTAAAGK